MSIVDDRAGLVLSRVAGFLLSVLAIAFELGANSAIGAEPPPDWQVCSGEGNPSANVRLKACTTIIETKAESGITVAQAYGNRAIAHLNNLEEIQAVADFRRAVELDPSSASGHVFLGLLNSLLKDHEQALVHFDEAIRLNSSNPLAFNGRGNVYYDRKEYDRAIVEYSEAIRLKPKYAPFSYNRGRTFLAKNELTSSLPDLNEAIELNPTYASALVQRGLLYLRKKQFDLAIADETAAIELRPTAAAYLNRGVAYRALNQPDRAIVDFNSALRLKPDYGLALVERGITYDSSGDYDRSLADLEHALLTAPDDVRARYARGLTYYHRADLDRAVLDFDDVLRRNPRHAAAYVQRGIAYREKGDLTRSISDFDRAIEIAPRYAAAYLSRCLDRTKIGHSLKDAVADCDTALRLEPKQAPVLRIRGYAWLKLKSYKSAETDFADALNLDPKDAYSMYGRALVRYQRDDVSGADADVAAAWNERKGIAGQVLKYFGVTASHEFSMHIAKERLKGNAIIFTVAEGPANACGPGCSTWIVADGGFDAGAEKKFRAFLSQLKRRDLPLFINSSGGLMSQGYSIGKLLRSNKIAASVAVTEPDGCLDDKSKCREKLRSDGIVQARLRIKGAVCHSACLYALMGAPERHVPDGALVGVHKPLLGGPEASSRSTLTQREAKALADRRRYAEQMGMDAGFVDWADKTPYEQLHVLTHDEIVRFRLETTPTGVLK